MAIRTTSDDAGPPEGIATGMGPSPELALSALQRAAQAAAGEAVASAEGQIPRGFAARVDQDLPHVRHLRERRFEVVDVRLVPAPVHGGESGWLAYGTLVSARRMPGPSAGDPKPVRSYRQDMPDL